MWCENYGLLLIISWGSPMPQLKTAFLEDTDGKIILFQELLSGGK